MEPQFTTSDASVESETANPKETAREKNHKAYLEQEEALRLRKLAEAEEDRMLWEEEAKKQQAARRKVLAKAIVALFMGWTGALLLYSGYAGNDWLAFIKAHAQEITGGLLLVSAAAFLTLPEILTSPRFRDVDIRRRFFDLEKASIAKPIEAWPFPVAKRIDEGTITTGSDESKQFGRDPFRLYFLTIKDVLEEKASDAEEKASILLDKGTTYTIGGIIFFVISIIAWQVLSWIHGFKTEFIYGIASCSALFIFIEFLSAWFLKQYRHYVDTSTYLLKVKAIFDRYMLVYLASNTLSSTDEDDKQKQVLIEMLTKDITWPESYLLKREDLSFAKEAASSLSSLIKELRSKDDNKKKGDD